MKLGEKRTKFTKMVIITILYAEMLGYEVRFDREHSKHIKNSLHFEGLAKDLLLFKNGVYLTKTEDYEMVGLFWEFIGGAWGGRFDDGNHFSFAYNGVK